MILELTDNKLYGVDEFGNAYSKKSGVWKKLSIFPGKGYYRFSSYPGNVIRYVHLEVLKCFIGPQPLGKWGLHRDGNSFNNSLENLYWGTPSENTLDAIKHGKYVDNRGSRHGMAKLTESEVACILRLLKEGHRSKDIAVCFNVSTTAISVIKTGRYWKHVKV